MFYNIPVFHIRIFILGSLLALTACSARTLNSESSPKTAAAVAEGDQLVVEGVRAYNDAHFEIAEAQLLAALEKPLTKYAPEEVEVLLGNVYKESQQYERALEAYEKAIAKNPHYHTALVNQGIVYRLLKKFDKAEQNYQAALKIAPKDAHLLTSLGALSANRKDYSAAVQYFKKSIAIEPDLDVSYGNLAYTYAAMGDRTNAEKYLELAQEKGYDNLEPLRSKIRSLPDKR